MKVARLEVVNIMLTKSRLTNERQESVYRKSTQF